MKEQEIFVEMKKELMPTISEALVASEDGSTPAKRDQEKAEIVSVHEEEIEASPAKSESLKPEVMGSFVRQSLTSHKRDSEVLTSIKTSSSATKKQELSRPVLKH